MAGLDPAIQPFSCTIVWIGRLGGRP